MGEKGTKLPGDFTPVDGCVPEWIDIKQVCSEAKRFVGLYLVDGFNIVAINNGRTVYTTADRNGEFRRRFTGAAGGKVMERSPTDHDAVLVYDCQDRREWLAPRISAVQFLYQQTA